MHPKTIKRCRVCGNTHLEPVIDLGMQYLQGSFAKEGMRPPPMRKLPLELVRCDAAKEENACGLLQLAHTFPPEILYANYWYRSGTNHTMRAHLKDIAEEGMRLRDGKPGTAARVLDIGCNDGTLLAAYPGSYVKFGVDPSDIARDIQPPVTVINTVFPSPATLAAIPPESLDIVTSIAMFYDLDNPTGFARAVKELLAPKGIWCLEMSYMPLMLARNSFDTICHEHLEYYSLGVIEHLMEQAGLRVFRISLNEINGGSFRIWATHRDNLTQGGHEDADYLGWLRIREFEMELDTPEPYRAFQSRIAEVKEKTLSLLTGLRSEGKSIHIYGASTKGNVLLQWYGLNRLWIEAASDRNPDKVGARTLGTDIPIISEADSRSRKPDYYLVLPWHFIGEFLRRERETIMAGSKMIFPLPDLRIVDASTVDAVLASLEADEKASGQASAERAVREFAPCR